MVLYNAAKAARHAGSIINRPTCGGPKKAGLATRSTWSLRSTVSMRRAVNTLPTSCQISTIPGTQRIGYRATLGPN